MSSMVVPYTSCRDAGDHALHEIGKASGGPGPDVLGCQVICTLAPYRVRATVDGVLDPVAPGVPAPAWGSAPSWCPPPGRHRHRPHSRASVGARSARSLELRAARRARADLCGRLAWPGGRDHNCHCLPERSALQSDAEPVRASDLPSARLGSKEGERHPKAGEPWRHSDGPGDKVAWHQTIVVSRAGMSCDAR